MPDHPEPPVDHSVTARFQAEGKRDVFLIVQGKGGQSLAIAAGFLGELTSRGYVTHTTIPLIVTTDLVLKNVKG